MEIMPLGKTSILEAVFLCSIGRSFRAKKEKELINLEKTNSKIEIEYQKSDRDGIIVLEIEDKKSFSVNGIKLKKLSEILGNIYVVMFNPNDIDILKDGPSERRRFLDIMISQLRIGYVYNMNQYLKTLEQRNNYLRQIKETTIDFELLETWDGRLAELGEKIYNYRSDYIEKIKEKIKVFHSQITEDKEEIKIKYISSCENKEIFLKKLKENREKDIQKGYTTEGVHRDDFYIYVNGKLVNTYGSQGQQRTTIISLKLSELEIIYDEIGEYPILLLDDFMSELDDKRIKNFLERIKNNQVLITCTDKIKVENQTNKIFYVEKGIVTEEN